MWRVVYDDHHTGYVVRFREYTVSRETVMSFIIGRSERASGNGPVTNYYHQ